MIELVGKVGSMALLNAKKHGIDETKFFNIGARLKPGMVWVTSGAVEIGRVDHINRTGKELKGEAEANKTDYASQGQAILMQMYRRHVSPQYGVRQILVEHNHFNNDKKREHIKALLLRAASQNAVPIVNYNDAVSLKESRKLEIDYVKEQKGEAVELIDNDETASQIACLVKAKTLLILSTLEGIYLDINDKGSLVKKIEGKDPQDVFNKLDELQKFCLGASRMGANGAGAKLEYIKPCIEQGTRVIIASVNYDINDILNGAAPSTMIYTA